MIRHSFVGSLFIFKVTKQKCSEENRDFLYLMKNESDFLTGAQRKTWQLLLQFFFLIKGQDQINLLLKVYI